MKEISIKELAMMASKINKSNQLIRFKADQYSCTCWMTMIKLNGNNMYAIIIPSYTCEVEMSCEPLEETTIAGFLLDNEENFNGKSVYLVDDKCNSDEN